MCFCHWDGVRTRSDIVFVPLLTRSRPGFPRFLCAPVRQPHPWRGKLITSSKNAKNFHFFPRFHARKSLARWVKYLFNLAFQLMQLYQYFSLLYKWVLKRRFWHRVRILQIYNWINAFLAKDIQSSIDLPDMQYAWYLSAEDKALA